MSIIKERIVINGVADAEVAGQNLSKVTLVANTAAKYGITKKLAEDILDNTFEAIATAVAIEGKTFIFPGMGTFKRAVLPAGEARNPQNGEKVQVPARYKVKLKHKPYLIQDTIVEGDVVASNTAPVDASTLV